MKDTWIIILRWLIGLFFSLYTGNIIVRSFLEEIRSYILSLILLRLPEEKSRVIIWSYYPISTYPPDYPWLVGLTERLFFMLLVAFGKETAIAMIAWITIKATVANWYSGQHRKVNVLEMFASLLAGLVSMVIALIGGLIIFQKFSRIKLVTFSILALILCIPLVNRMIFCIIRKIFEPNKKVNTPMCHND